VTFSRTALRFRSRAMNRCASKLIAPFREAAMKSFLLLLLFSAAAMAQTVDGDVFDAVTGAPLAGASVAFPGWIRS